MVTRLSKKAQEAASALSAHLDNGVREYASLLAQSDHKEFADESHVKEAYRLLILKIAGKFPPPTRKDKWGRDLDECGQVKCLKCDVYVDYIYPGGYKRELCAKHDGKL